MEEHLLVLVSTIDDGRIETMKKEDDGNLNLRHYSIAAAAAAAVGCTAKMIYCYLLFLLLPEKSDVQMMMILGRYYYDAVVEDSVRHFRVHPLESLDSIDFLDFHTQVSMKKMIQVQKIDDIAVAVENADGAMMHQHT
jgi:hypothetical protein